MNSTPVAEPTSNGRDANGRFTKGNRGGPGNPFARQVAALRKILLQAATPEVMEAIAGKLIELALKGDLRAIQLLFAYTLGKPAAAADPDQLDLEEWELFKQVADMPNHWPKVMTAPHPDLTLQMARATGPAMAKEMGQRLRAGLLAQDGAEAAPAKPANGGQGANGTEPPSGTGRNGAQGQEPPLANGLEPPSANGGNGAKGQAPPPANRPQPPSAKGRNGAHGQAPPPANRPQPPSAKGRNGAHGQAPPPANRPQPPSAKGRNGAKGRQPPSPHGRSGT
jgi:hypothetical protein